LNNIQNFLTTKCSKVRKIYDLLEIEFDWNSSLSPTAVSKSYTAAQSLWCQLETVEKRRKQQIINDSSSATLPFDGNSDDDDDGGKASTSQTIPSYVDFCQSERWDLAGFPTDKNPFKDFTFRGYVTLQCIVYGLNK
jgi:hypothetical protein